MRAQGSFNHALSKHFVWVSRNLGESHLSQCCRASGWGLPGSVSGLMFAESLMGSLGPVLPLTLPLCSDPPPAPSIRPLPVWVPLLCSCPFGPSLFPACILEALTTVPCLLKRSLLPQQKVREAIPGRDMSHEIRAGQVPGGIRTCPRSPSSSEQDQTLKSLRTHTTPAPLEG